MTIDQALEKLFSLHKFGIKLGLDSIRDLLDVLGNPQNKLKTIHIAGSNGKGSTSSFIASILTEAGYKVGLYTSPHFVRFNERIRINGIEIDDQTIADFVSSLDDYIEEKKPTFFEVTTALAFSYFEKSGVDFAVIETGLGGRLDATNVINPMVSVITTISLEHTNILGETLEKIAAEKAGIIKPGIPVITGLLPEEAEIVIKSRAAGFSSQHYRLNDNLSIQTESVSLKIEPGRISIYSLPLKGKHQFTNAALAIMAVDKALHFSDPSIYLSGLKNVISNTGIQGRYEIYSENPRIIFDSAHNPEGVKIFLDEFRKEYGNYTQRFLIFGAMRDKNIKEMLSALEQYFDEVLFTSVEMERAAAPAELMEIASGCRFRAGTIDNPASLIGEFAGSKSGKCLVILGSMYLVGEIKAKIS